MSWFAAFRYGYVSVKCCLDRERVLIEINFPFYEKNI